MIGGNKYISFEIVNICIKKENKINLSLTARPGPQPKKTIYAGNLDFALCSALVTLLRFASIRPSNSPLGFEQIRPSQTRHWPRVHFCLPAGFPTSARCSLHRGFPLKKPDRKQINSWGYIANFYNISRDLHIVVQSLKNSSMNSVLPEGLVILADKGYASEKNRNLLADRRHRAQGCREQAAHNRTAHYQQANKLGKA